MNLVNLDSIGHIHCTFSDLVLGVKRLIAQRVLLLRRQYGSNRVGSAVLQNYAPVGIIACHALVIDLVFVRVNLRFQLRHRTLEVD